MKMREFTKPVFRVALYRKIIPIKKSTTCKQYSACKQYKQKLTHWFITRES